MTDRHRSEERGFTLIEVMVTSALILVVLAIVLPQLAGGLNLFATAQVRSDTTDAAQVALGRIEHDVVSSNVLYLDATLAGGAGIVHLQTFGAGGVSTCVEYQVANSILQRRTKDATTAAWPAAGVGWANVMTGIVNSSQPGPPAVFANSVASQYRSLVVTLWVNADTRTVGTAPPAKYTTTITGRAIANQSSTTGPC